MALIVEDGTGVPDAESLASVAFADTYHANRGNVAWQPLANEVKEQLLRKATDYTVSTYAAAWKSIQTYPLCPMPFPRDLYGLVVPIPVQQSIAELALIAKDTPLFPTLTRGKKRVKIGPLEVEYDGNAATVPLFLAASTRIASFLTGFGSGPFVKLQRT